MRPKNHDTILRLRISERDKQKLKQIAQNSGTTVSQVIRNEINRINNTLVKA